jgi:hypothetical protein
MGKTYDQAPDEVRDRSIALIKRFHPDLEKVQVRIDFLMASTDSETGHAVTCGGYPAYAVVRVLGPKERTMERGDAEIVIDRDAYEAMNPATRDALLDHELYHLEVKRDQGGQVKRDDHGRPVLKLRKHDFQVGWFHEIARRHGMASIEVTQATSLKEEQGQVYFEFAGDDTRGAFTEQPSESVTIKTGNVGVKIDKDGIHPLGTERTDTDDIDDATIDEAAMWINTAHSASTSVLQRRMSIGYNRASAILAELERRGIVGPENGSEPRQILKQTAAA